MKKTFEYLYIFSKLSTSFILLLTILIFGYFFYKSFKNQEESSNDQVELINKLSQNAKSLSKLSEKIEMTDSSLYEIQKSIQNNTNTNNSEKIILLNKKIEELDITLENVLASLKEIQSLNISKLNAVPENNTSSMILEKQKIDIVKLVIYKFENNLDFDEELDILQSFNHKNKKHIFDKINLIRLKNFRGNVFLKNVYSKELDFFLKENFNKNYNNFISKSLMKFVKIEPSKKNKIKNDEINLLYEISALLDEKNYKLFYKKIINVNNYEKYFSNTINQIQIAIDFKELINMAS